MATLAPFEQIARETANRQPPRPRPDSGGYTRLLLAVVKQARRDTGSRDQARAAAAAYWLRCELCNWAGSMGLDIPPAVSSPE